MWCLPLVASTLLSTSVHAAPEPAEADVSSGMPPSTAAPAPPPEWALPVVAEGELSAERLAAALSAYIRVDTQNPAGPDSWASHGDQPQWIAFLTTTWADPLGLEWERMGDALVIRVPGTEAVPPVLWLTHADVVPVDPGDLDSWTQPPFDGVVEGGVVYGRGALDVKCATIMQLEAVRALLESGQSLRTPVTLLITTDEESFGDDAPRLAGEFLHQLGDPEVVLDEGGFMVPDFYGDFLMATVAVAEKTSVSVELTVVGEGGHASMPREGAPIDRLVGALEAIRGWETEQRLIDPMRETFLRVAERESFPTSWVLGNPGLFESIIVGIVDDSAAGNAVTRNTIALTMLDAGVKDNVVPGAARATFNARLLPGVDPADFMADLAEVIDDDQVVARLTFEPTWGPPSSHETPFFETLERVILQQHPEAIVVPNLTPATMDSRHFAAAGLDTYRFVPVTADKEARGRIHGNDERLAVEELVAGATVYLELLRAL